MKTGISFSIFGKKTCVMGGSSCLPEEIHFAQCNAFGIDTVELLVMEGYLTPGDWETLNRVISWANQYGININSIHGPSGWPTNGHWMADPDDEIRIFSVHERKLAIETAQRLGTRYCVVEFEAYPHWPYWPHNQKQETVFPHSFDRWRRSLDELLDTADRTGIQLAIENIDGLPTEKLVEVVDELERNLAGICFDTSHASFNGGIQQELDLLAPYIIGAHLSDNDALTGAEFVDRHWLPFAGNIDWHYLTSKIVQHSPCECMILEILDRENPVITENLANACREIESISNTIY